MSSRILVVDDSPAMRALIRRILRICGIDAAVHEAANGAEALLRVREAMPDLILCDINMPVMNGEELVAALRAENLLPRTAVVVVSTDATRTRVGRILELGALGYVRKPFTPEELRNSLEEIVPTLFAGAEAL